MSSAIGSVCIQRMIIIDNALRKFAVPTYKLIEKELEDAGFPASKRTILRDIECMKNEYGAPEVKHRRCRAEENGGKIEYGLHYDFEKHEDPDWELNVEQITAQDLEAIRLAHQFIEKCQGLPTSVEDLNKAYKKLLDLADSQIQDHVDTGLESIAFAPVIQQHIKADVWRNVTEAAKKHKSIRMEYNKKQSWNPEEGQESRLVDPYYIVNLSGAWYLIGTRGLNDTTICQYDMARILSAKITEASFSIPENLDINKILRVTFGRFIGDPDNLVNVKVRFSAKVATLLNGRCFHAQEKRTKDRQGRTTLSFPVTPIGATPEWRYYHVRSWILSWGPDCEVLEPPELQDLVRNDIESMLRISNGKKE